MAQLLKDVAVGSIVKIKENGVAQNYIIVNQGLPSSMYDSSCNGTWLLKQNYWTSSTWNSNGETSSDFQNNRPFQLLNNKFLNILDSNIRSTILKVKIPYKLYYNSSVSTGSNGYSCKAFLLSGYEMGMTTIVDPGGILDPKPLPQDGAILSYFQGTNPSGSDEKRAISVEYWTRSIGRNTSSVFIVGNGGQPDTSRADLVEYIRPALVMPSNILVDSSNNVTSYSIPPVSFLSVPSLGMVDQTITIEWSSISVSDFTINYQLQRNINNEGWQNVGSTISETSYTDTAQIGWGQVQYQVAPIVEGAIGNYTQSDIIPIVNPSALVISGSDANLGALTSNIPYTVSSNTGNPISLTRIVNNVQVTTLTVESGFAYSIPIVDLPTGVGTIVITASVQSGLETVTQTRTWTYYKTPINIPSTGGIAQLTQNGQNIWPVTVPDAVEAPVYLGGNLNAALNKLGQAALYTKSDSPKYNQVTVDLSKVSVGDEVSLPYNDVMVPHIVVHIGNPNSGLYDNSCDGVWLLRKDCISQGQWNSSNVNTLSGSTIMSTMAEYLTNYSSEVQSAIKAVKIPYCVGGGNTTINSGSNGLECKMFPLGAYELGFIQSYNQYIPIDGTKLDYFSQNNSIDEKRIGYYNGKKVVWYTRTPSLANSNSSLIIETFGMPFSFCHVNSTNYYRPCFIMPITFNQTYYVDSSNNIHPAQEYTQGGSITDVFGYDVPIAQSEEGTYQGTGTSGSSSPTSITVSFVPKFICITNQSDNSKRAFLPFGGYGVCWTQDMTTTNAINVYGLGTTWGNNNVSWYSNNAIQQMNENGDTYQYVVFG